MRQLARAEEFLDRRGNRLGVDNILRHQAFGLNQTQAIAHRALDAHDTGTEGVLRHFANAADTPVTEMIDIIDMAIAIPNIDQHFHHIDDIIGRQNTFTIDTFAPQAAIEFHTPYFGQVITLGVEEQVLKQIFGGFARRRLTGTHHAIDFHLGFEIVSGRIERQ